MPDDILGAIRLLLTEGDMALTANELEVTSVEVEWTRVDGKMRPRLYVALEPKDG